MKGPLKEPDPQLIKMVANTAKTIADHHGYKVYPDEHMVKMVLQALLILKSALEVVDETRGSRTDKGTK